MKNKIRFFLQGRENREGKRQISISFRFANHRLLCSTGQMIEPVYWDDVRYRVKKGSQWRMAINRELSRLELALATSFAELSGHGAVTPEVLKAAVFPGNTKQGDESPQDLFTLYRRYLSENESMMTKGTAKVHYNVTRHLEKFVQVYDLSASLSQINTPFIEKFIHYLLSVAGLTNPTAEKIVRTFRVILNWANEHGIPTSQDFKKFTAKTFPHGQHSQKIYLNADDLSKIETLDLTDNERLHKVRDVLLFQCWTGLRYGDLLALRREHVKTNNAGESEIELVTGKNKKAVRIPLLPTALRIWNAWEGNLPTISNQRQNSYLKELCALAGIDTPCLTVTYRGTQRLEKTLPKYDLVGTHTAKRTFVTLLALSGVSLASIMKITGNSRNTIETYLVATDADAANEVRAKFAA